MSAKKNPRMQLATYKRWCANRLNDLKVFGEKYQDGIPPEMRGQFERLVNDLRDQFTRFQSGTKSMIASLKTQIYSKS